ncbi:MAG: response regulator transcription factor [Bacteroidota bacterium]
MSHRAKKYKILVVDDDKDILDLLQYNLEREGYEVRSETRSTRSVETALEFAPNLIILDIMMPYVNGIEVCRQLRSIEHFKSTYIFFLTAKSDKHLQIEALNTGGDDYIEKITGLRALSYKVGTVLKKNLVIRKSISEIKVGELLLDRNHNTARVKDRSVELSQHEFELLYFLAQNPRKSITRDSLLHNIWGSDVYLFAKSIDTYVQNITQKLGINLISKVKEDQYRLKAS